MKFTKPNVPVKLPLEKRLLNLFLNILKYPFRIAKKYESYNMGIGDLISVKNEPNVNGKDDKYFREFQRKNTRLVFFCIYLPLILGFISTSLMIYKNKENYSNYYKQASAPIKEDKFTKKISAYWNKAYYIVAENPVTSDEYTPVLIAFFISLMGAKFLSINPVFEIKERIEKNLVALGCTDIEGNPWRVVWTPEAMLFVSFGTDPNKLAQEQKFWTTINFPPSLPKQSKKDMNKFVVQRKYELSSNMVFKLGDKDESK